MLPRLISAPVALHPSLQTAAYTFQSFQTQTCPVACVLCSWAASSPVLWKVGQVVLSVTVFLGIFQLRCFPWTLRLPLQFSLVLCVSGIYFSYFNSSVFHLLLCDVHFPDGFDGFVNAPTTAILESLSKGFSPWIWAWRPVPVGPAFGRWSRSSRPWQAQGQPELPETLPPPTANDNYYLNTRSVSGSGVADVLTPMMCCFLCCLLFLTCKVVLNA